MANIITCIRIICSAALLSCPAFSPAFYALYITAGLSDMADGPIARKMGRVSEFGSKLDTAYVMRKEIVVLHTAMNKVTGVMLFVLPMTLTFINLKISGVIVSSVATFAAIQEGHLIRTGEKHEDG